jgi:hypothetical protein
VIPELAETSQCFIYVAKNNSGQILESDMGVSGNMDSLMKANNLTTTDICNWFDLSKPQILIRVSFKDIYNNNGWLLISTTTEGFNGNKIGMTHSLMRIKTKPSDPGANKIWKRFVDKIKLEAQLLKSNNGTWESAAKD